MKVMTEQAFRHSLPASTECEVCGKELAAIQWQIGRYGPAQWFGIGITKCEACAVVRIAAAGSDDLAHSYARAARLKFLRSIGQVH
jgi:hypothetical protein